MGPVSKAPRVMDASAPLSPPPFSTLQCRVALGLPSSAAPGFDTGTASAHDNVPSSLVGPEGGVWLSSAQPPPLLPKTPSVERRQVMTMSWDKMKKKWLSAQFSQVFFFLQRLGCSLMSTRAQWAISKANFDLLSHLMCVTFHGHGTSQEGCHCDCILDSWPGASINVFLPMGIFHQTAP